MANVVYNKKSSKSLSVASRCKSFALHPLRPITSLNQWKIGNATGIDIASFLIKTIALETVRRFSQGRCPFLWTGLQSMQVLCYPPIKWIQRWKPFGFLVKGMQMLSQPLLLLSIANALSDLPYSRDLVVDDAENSRSDDDSQLASESVTASPSLELNQSMSIGDENPQAPSSTDWFYYLCRELQSQEITLPERFSKEDLQRFYVAANGDLSSLLSSVKKTIRWRETYKILSEEELEMWSNMIFWHGLDVKNRPCLVIRLGLACISLSSQDRPGFVQAVVSQVEYGVLHFIDGENPQITVLMDCQGLSPLRFPMQMMRYCCNLLQDHFPNVLGCLIVIRLPPVVRVIAQTFIQVLKPTTKQKLRIEGDTYMKVLSERLKTLPSYLGGPCTCLRCARLDTGSVPQTSDCPTTTNAELATDDVNSEEFPLVEPTYQYDMVIDDYCSRTLRTAVIGILIIWVLFAFLEGIFDPASRPVLPRDI